MESMCRELRTIHYFLLACVALVIVGLVIGLGFVIAGFGEEDSPVRSQKHFEHAVVAADAVECSIIGRDILKKGGSAGDAAVASLVCTGLFNAQSAGIGGGAFVVYYDKATGEKVFLNGRECAPLDASEDMFSDSTTSSTKGGLAIAVPGEVKVMWELHQRYGKLEWRELFEPSIKWAREGFVVSVPLGNGIQRSKRHIEADPNLREVFMKDDGELYKSGDKMTMPKLADSLQVIAEEGPDAFYTGSLADDIVAEIKEYGGIITKEDLREYEVAEKAPLEINLDSWQLYSVGAPGSGPVLSLMLNILEGYRLAPDSISNTDSSVLTFHRMIEAFKFGYAKRSALGDEDFVDGMKGLVEEMISQEYADSLRDQISDDHTHTFEYYEPSFMNREDSGTSHISIVDEDGNACAVSATINLYFGSKVRGNRTGIIFNNEMDDFSQPGADNVYGVPPSPSNFIVPKKRPMSSMVPTIIVDGEGNVRQVLGASGGTRITTAVATTIMYTKWLGVNLEDAIERRRIHHQLVPTTAFCEPESVNSKIEQVVIERLHSEKGHNITEFTKVAVVQGINRLEDGWLDAHCDSRKGGWPAGY